jgi:hypothetical protein
MPKVAELLNKRIFWDIDPDKLDWDKHAQFIIERTLARGDTSDVRTIFQKYTKEDLAKAVLKSRGVLTSRVANYMSQYLEIPYSSINVAPEYY